MKYPAIGQPTHGHRPQVYIVSYELKAFSWFYKKLFEELQRSLTWWHFLDKTWIIVRTESMDELNIKLTGLIYPSDSLLIMPAKRPAAGMLPPEAWAWLETNVPT